MLIVLRPRLIALEMRPMSFELKIFCISHLQLPHDAMHNSAWNAERVFVVSEISTSI